MRMLIAGAGLIAAILAVGAAAQPPARPDPSAPLTRADVESRIKTRFEQIDANHDGFITWEEVAAFRNGQRAKLRAAAFDRLDTNHDGSISRQEFDADRGGFGRLGGRPGSEGGPPPAGGPDGAPGGPRFGMRGARGMDGAGPGRGRGMGSFGMGGGAGGFGPEMFARADSDRDGRISLAEAEALPLRMFDRIDANHDGTVTPEERKQAREGMRSRWQRREG